MENNNTIAACVTEIVRLIAVFSDPKGRYALPSVSSNSANNAHQEMTYVLGEASECDFMIATPNKAWDKQKAK